MSEQSEYIFNPVIALIAVGITLVVMYFVTHDTSDPADQLELKSDKVIIYSSPELKKEFLSEDTEQDYIIEEPNTEENPFLPLFSKEEPEEKPEDTQKSDSLFFAALMAQSPKYDHPVKHTIIRYYTKDKDKNRVFNLQNYGFYIHERPSPLQSTHTSNMIHVGDSVTNQDVLLVGYQLIKSGMDIKDISFSREHAGWKSNAIEIGTDTTIMDKKPMTLKDLKMDWGQM
ncbi:hypothetical protein [Reichenbachiella ulvae]|uniref:Uncharacterized protein n=1 Tax=Reichenbachiella ulvae TaxID=2980104 RepID=A0ABT3CY44_9BACT|nr:hypothetical protein [Reichenbachiella ulvae]MCV9388615.1 hypothetical protein [Reichenbachiella ulvae]